MYYLAGTVRPEAATGHVNSADIKWKIDDNADHIVWIKRVRDARRVCCGLQSRSATICSAISRGSCVVLRCGSIVGRIFDRRGWNLLGLSHPFGGSLFGLEQLFHCHRLVDMVFGARDLLTRDQKPHIRIHQVLRPRSSSRSEDLFAVATERELGRAEFGIAAYLSR